MSTWGSQTLRNGVHSALKYPCILSILVCESSTSTDHMLNNGYHYTGDSRCVLSRDGAAVPLSIDHKPVLVRSM